MSEAARVNEGMQSLKVKLIGLPVTRNLWGFTPTEHTTFLPLDVDYEIVNKTGGVHKCSKKIEMYECRRDLSDKLIYNYVKTIDAIEDCSDCQAIINKEKIRNEQIKSITVIEYIPNYSRIGRSENGQYWKSDWDEGYYDGGSWEDWEEITERWLFDTSYDVGRFIEALEQIELPDAEQA